MIDTEVMAEGWEEPTVEEDDTDDLFREVYVETATGVIYEVQMFDSFCLVRPASPNMYGGIKKFNHVEFSGKFHEYGGDPDEVRDYIRGASPDFIVGESSSLWRTRLRRLRHVRKVLYAFCDEHKLAENEYKMPEGLTIIHGGARGADSLSRSMGSCQLGSIRRIQG
jgi:hypothetical protein